MRAADQKLRYDLEWPHVILSLNIASYSYKGFLIFDKRGFYNSPSGGTPRPPYFTASIDSVIYDHAIYSPPLQEHLPPSLGVCAYPSESNNRDAYLRSHVSELAIYSWLYSYIARLFVSY